MTKKKQTGRAARVVSKSELAFPTIDLDELQVDALRFYAEQMRSRLNQMSPQALINASASAREAGRADEISRMMLVSYVRLLLSEWVQQQANLPRVRVAQSRRETIQRVSKRLGRWPTMDDVTRAIGMPHDGPIRMVIQADLQRLQAPQVLVDRSPDAQIERFKEQLRRPIRMVRIPKSGK